MKPLERWLKTLLAMDPSLTVYRKTPAGLAESKQRLLQLPRKTFSLLLAIDGQRSVGQLCSTLSAFGNVQVLITALERAGLIESNANPQLAPEPGTGDVAPAQAAAQIEPAVPAQQGSAEAAVQIEASAASEKLLVVTSAEPILRAPAKPLELPMEMTRKPSTEFLPLAQRPRHEPEGLIEFTVPSEPATGPSIQIGGVAPDAQRLMLDSGSVDVRTYEAESERERNFKRSRLLMISALSPYAGIDSVDLLVAIEQCLTPRDLARILPDYLRTMALSLDDEAFKAHLDELSEVLAVSAEALRRCAFPQIPSPA